MSFPIFILLILWTVDTTLLQAEMAALDSTPLPNVVVKALFILLLIVGGTVRFVSGKTQPIPRLVFRLWAAFTLYLIIETVILVLRFGYPADYLLFSYNAYYFAILLIPLFFCFRSTLSESTITTTLLLFFVPLTALGLAQYFTNSPIVPTDSPNGYLQVMSWDFIGSIRAFALFSSPAMFGHFLALMAGLGLAFCLGEKGSARKGIAITVLALLGGFSTLTRATEFEIAGVLMTVWMLYRSRHPKLLSALPLIYGVFGILLAFVVPLLGTLQSDDVLSDASLIERYIGWARYGGLWIGNGLATFLLGAGLAQNDRFRPGAGVVVDNSFIGVGVHIGLFGVVLWIAITWVIWMYMLREAKKISSPLRAAAAGAYSVRLFTSIFGINLFSPLPFVLLLQTGLPRSKTGEGGQSAGGAKASRTSQGHRTRRRPHSGRGVIASVAMKILYDSRWTRNYGIGRSAGELQKLLPHLVPFEADRAPSHPLDPMLLSAALWNKKPDLFFSPGYNSPLVSPCPFVFTLHDLNHLRVRENSNTAKRAFYEYVIKPACCKAAFVLTVSEYSRNQILEWSGIDERRIVNVGSGVGPPFTPEGKRHDPGYPYLLYVGNHKPHKNLGRLLEAFAASGIHKDVCLVLTGTMSREMAHQIARLQLNRSVVFLGEPADEELSGLYRGSLGLVFPSLYEGFGLPALEALACGIPVLSSAVCSLPEVVGDAGILVDPLSVESIADGISRLAYDQDLRTRLGMRGPLRAEKFSWAETARKTWGALELAVAMN